MDISPQTLLLLLTADSDAFGESERPKSYPDADLLIQRLIERFGSRRALIEEIDRRKRLALMDTRSIRVRVPIGGRNPTIRNEPNPQWREISSPSLLISGEITPTTRHITETTTLHQAISLEQPSTRRCKACKCSNDDFTPGCSTCDRRHRERKRLKDMKTAVDSLRKDAA